MLPRLPPPAPVTASLVRELSGTGWWRAAPCTVRDAADGTKPRVLDRGKDDGTHEDDGA
ncbi:hypothetical protein GCM10022244_04690 [Streptomyces gulbargensis]|uniref:Uncharacterized protein n=1 Tax=Streptomyces gulbargensis TaxID=364901 RepID=A0ABP7LBG1_9ACTN